MYKLLQIWGTVNKKSTIQTNFQFSECSKTSVYISFNYYTSIQNAVKLRTIFHQLSTRHQVTFKLIDIFERPFLF